MPPAVRQWVKWAPVRAPGRRWCSAPRRARCVDGRSVASPEDIRAVALPVLRHRVLLNFQAEADGIDAGSDRRATARSGGPVTRTTNPESSIPIPTCLAQIADLELVARIVVEGLVSGLHRSPFHGYSAEFSQYRHYRPGDDLSIRRLEAGRAHRSRLHQAVPRDHEHGGRDRRRHERIDGLSDRFAPVQASLRGHRGGGARAPHRHARRCDRPDGDARPSDPSRASGSPPSKVEGGDRLSERAGAAVSARRGRAVSICARSWRRCRRSSARGEWHAAETIRRAAERVEPARVDARPVGFLRRRGADLRAAAPSGADGTRDRCCSRS